MSRKYFTDPIKVLWMYKEFGVKFYADTEIGLINFADFEVDDGDISIEEFLEITRLYPKQLYVAKESEHIFDPKDMDYGTTERNVWKGFCQYSDVRGYKGWNYVSGGVCKESVRIIMRDDKQFFNAENENI